MKLSRFTVETHCHAQRHAAQMSKDDGGYNKLARKMHAAVPSDEADEDTDVVVYDNSEPVLYDMDNYGVDMCILLPGYGMENRINQQIMEDNPGKFVAAAAPVQTKKRHIRGEEEWTWDAAKEELNEWLSKDGFCMIGEGLATHPDTKVGRPDEDMPWPERREELRHSFEVAADNDVPVRWHSGTATTGYGIGRRLLPDYRNPTYAAEMKKEFPEVPIIFDHGGQNGHWREIDVDRACQIAASWDDVYLEVGLYWADLMEKPYYDENIGPEQMIWGGDWGASMSQVSRPGRDPPFYWDQVADRGLPAHQPNYWGAAKRQMLKFAQKNDIEQEKLDLIMGGNIARLLDLDLPHSRVFERYVDR